MSVTMSHERKKITNHIAECLIVKEIHIRQQQVNGRQTVGQSSFSFILIIVYQDSSNFYTQAKTTVLLPVSLHNQPNLLELRFF